MVSDGSVLRRRVEPTPRQAAGPDALLALMAEFVGSTGVTEAVIGVPGRVDYSTGRLKYAPNMPRGWAPAPSEAQLSSVLGVPVVLANDADLAAVGEARFGSGRGGTTGISSMSRSPPGWGPGSSLVGVWCAAGAPWPRWATR